MTATVLVFVASNEETPSVPVSILIKRVCEFFFFIFGSPYIILRLKTDFFITFECCKIKLNSISFPF